MNTIGSTDEVIAMINRHTLHILCARNDLRLVDKYMEEGNFANANTLAASAIGNLFFAKRAREKVKI
jgi:hypothetical protein